MAGALHGVQPVPRLGAARVGGAGIVFENNSCPWGSGMNSTGFTLNIRIRDADGASYQWQYSPDRDGTWADIPGATAGQYKVTGTDSGTWYRCTVSKGGADATSKPVEAILSSATGDAHGRIWSNDWGKPLVPQQRQGGLQLRPGG